MNTLGRLGQLKPQSSSSSKPGEDEKLGWLVGWLVE